MHIVLRPPTGRHRARVCEGLPHGRDHVRACGGATGDGTRTGLVKVREKQPNAYLYGESDAGEYKRLNAFFLLTEEPAAYNLPEAPTMPTAGMKRKYLWSAVVGVGLSLVSAAVLGRGQVGVKEQEVNGCSVMSVMG